MNPPNPASPSAQSISTTLALLSDPVAHEIAIHRRSRECDRAARILIDENLEIVGAVRDYCRPATNHTKGRRAAHGGPGVLEVRAILVERDHQSLISDAAGLPRSGG